MKKCCSNCKALNLKRCSLNYKTTFYGFLGANTKPLEECPKPLTNKQFIKLIKNA